jgi:hypothetical protein
MVRGVYAPTIAKNCDGWGENEMRKDIHIKPTHRCPSFALLRRVGYRAKLDRLALNAPQISNQEFLLDIRPITSHDIVRET